METTKIGNICSFENGDRGENYPSKKDFVDKGIPFINSGNISNGKIEHVDLNYITEEKFNKLRAGKASRGDFVFTLRGSLGKNAIVEFDKCAIASMLVIMRPDESKIDKMFFKYAMNSPWLEKQVENVDNGSIQGNLGVSNVKDFFIPYPSMTEQKKIASILTVLDDKISTNNKIIETSEKLMREIYDYWFVQFDFPDENGRPYKSSGGEMVYNETLKREIPKGWKVVNIEDLAQLIWGQCPDGVNILEKDSEIPSLPYCSGAGDMDGGYIVSCQARTDNSRREVESGTILLSIAGTIGKMAIANEKISLGRATLGITPNDKKYYALVWLLLKMYNSRLKTASVGAVQKIINKSNMKELNIAIPNIADMDYEVLNSAMETIKSLSLENNKLASLRDWLLPMLMNGQIKVSD